MIDDLIKVSLCNGLASNRQQFIIWTNGDPIHWRIYASSGSLFTKRLISERLQFRLFQSHWNVTGTSEAVLPRCLSYHRAIRSLKHPLSLRRYFTRFGEKTCYRLVKRCPGLHGAARTSYELCKTHSLQVQALVFTGSIFHNAYINSLASTRSERNFGTVIFNYI